MSLSDAERLRLAVEDGVFVGNMGPLLVAEIRRLRSLCDMLLDSYIVPPGVVEPPTWDVIFEQRIGGQHATREAAVAEVLDYLLRRKDCFG